MRKTKRCAAVWLDQRGGRLTMRTCLHPRDHTHTLHTDEHGTWKEPAHDDQP